MKNILLMSITAISLLFFPNINYGQAPNLGTASSFVLFTSIGAVTNTGISQLTGNVGTNSGSSTGFGNVNGVMHDNDGASAQGAADLLIAYNQLNSTIPAFFPAPLLGNGQILTPGVYSIPSPATLNLGLTLNGLGNPGAVFIFQIHGTFSTAANSKIYLTNGTQACNVFWMVEGAVSMASGTTMRGTIIANNAAITMNTGDTLEGRALSTTGAVLADGTLAYTPIGCGSPLLMGPMAPALASTACYAVFSSDGPVMNVGITHLVGDVGTNVGLTTGFNPLFVTGAIHPIPDGSTAQSAADLLGVYTYLNTLPYDIELLYPAQFGNNLVLTPHTYLMNAATTFTDTLFLNAGGEANAVFVIKIYGALSTSTYSKVVLINGAQAKNVYWLVSGAVSINDYSIFKGTIISNNGAIDLTTGVNLEGRALTTTGAVSTSAITVIMPPGCSQGTGNSLSGVVQYDNDILSPMSNTTVNLKSGNTLIATTTTNASGMYSFSGIANGTYTLTGSSTKPWGGVNSTDALLIAKHFVGTNLLTGLPLLAADVDHSSYVNASDALWVMKRYVQIVTYFPAGDWVFGSHLVTLTGSGIFTDNLKALSFGDVNRSFIPELKTEPTVALAREGIQTVNMYEEFEVPLLTTMDMSVSAISMVINFPSELIEITDIAGPGGYGNSITANHEALLYFMNTGELRLSWYSLTPASLTPGQPMITLKMRLLPLASQLNAELLASRLNLLIDGISEIADEHGVSMMNVSLTTPKLVLNSSDFFLGHNYPNPFNALSKVAYTIPGNAMVNLSIFNTMGETVVVLVNGQKEAGIHTVDINAAGLSAGVYYYKLEAKGSGSDFVQIRKMIVSK